ncbi:hypothetical protein NPIL_530081 [Nephila pilipes]|uniref:Uncharacterized protein n=1 Tax=Nephila pilipes TaxID=299642 RepID=A0A8X6T4I9_NEPPI|nr:hypothetical protein NPIL_530081 [Nephila pilipes]
MIFITISDYNYIDSYIENISSSVANVSLMGVLHSTRNPIPQQNTQLHFKLLVDDEMPQMLKLSSFNILPSIFPTLPAGIHPPLGSGRGGSTEVEGASSLHQMPGGTGSSLVIRRQLIEGINLGGCWTGDQTDTVYNPHVSWLSLLFGVSPPLVMIHPPPTTDDFINQIREFHRVVYIRSWTTGTRCWWW